MDVNKNNVSQFLTASSTCFMIPVYQRNYDWSEDNCKQLWSDLWYITLSKENKTHFLGTICLNSTKNGREKIIIDGQQRITTITLMIKAAKDCAENEELKNDLDSNYLYNRSYATEEAHKVKLHLNRRDDIIYNKLLSNEKFTSADQLDEQEAKSTIYKNYRYFYDLLSTKSDDEIHNVIRALDRIIVIELAVEEENPQEIFESLNSTGLDLDAVDLLRNYLLMSLDYETQGTFYEKYWFKIEENVKPKNMVRFFIDYLIYSKKSDSCTYRGKTGHINENSLYHAFREYYQQRSGKQERYSAVPAVTESILKDMLRWSKVYKSLVFEDGLDLKALSEIDAIIYSIVYLNESKASRPLLMYVMEKFQRNRISEEDAIAMLKACLSMVFRSKVCPETSGVNGQFVGNALRLLPEDNLEDIVDKFWMALSSGSGKRELPSDLKFKDALISRPIYEVLRAKGTKYLLYSIELNSELAKGLPSYEDANTSIEHIMPQTLSESWQEDLGTDAELHSEFVDRLGNLTLSSNNSEMRNSVFKDKIEWYKKSSFAYTRKLAGYETWNISAIRKRSGKLADRCLEIWSVPKKYQKEPADQDKQRRKKFDFSMLALYKGDVITFTEDPSLSATIIEGSTVSFEGKEYKLSKLAALLLGRSSSRGINGTRYFEYDGKTLETMRTEVEEGLF